MEENRAKRLAFYRRMGVKTNGAVISKFQVLQFGQMMMEFFQLGGQDRDMFEQLRDTAARLVMIRAPTGCCDTCHQSIYCHERMENDLILVCQNERCRNVCFYFLDLFVW